VSAGLTYVCADSPGIARRRAGRGFSYRDSAGHRIADAKTLGRIRRLVIPAGWRAVWICAEPDGHIQAIDLDEKGRRQYRYHPRYRDVREGAKFQHMMAFAESLPTLGHRRAQGAIASVA
jgi:DNA topoisomerase-1